MNAGCQALGGRYPAQQIDQLLPLLGFEAGAHHSFVLSRDLHDLYRMKRSAL
jgi:hypothetical protein